VIIKAIKIGDYEEEDLEWLKKHRNEYKDDELLMKILDKPQFLKRRRNEN